MRCDKFNTEKCQAKKLMLGPAGYESGETACFQVVGDLEVSNFGSGRGGVCLAFSSH